MALSPQHLGCKVCWRATETTSLRVVHDADLRQAEVSEKGVAIFVIHNVIGLQITEDDITRMQVFKRQQNLSEVDTCSILSKSLIFLQGTAHISAWRVVKKQEELFRRLERILEPNNEGMVRHSHNITLRLRILHQVLAEDLLLVKNLHRVVLARPMRFDIGRQCTELFDKVDDTEGALAKLHDCLKILWSNELFTFVIFALKLLI